MKLLFKTTTETPVIVTDSNFKEHYPQVNNNTRWEPLAKMIKQVTKTYIIPFVTKEFYDFLADKYHADGEMTVKEKEVLELLQDAIAEYTVWKISPRMNVTVADFGVTEENGDRGTNNPATQWRYKHAMWNVMVDADNHLDAALKYIEENISDFDVFNLNRAKLLVNDCFVRNTAAVQAHVDISNSRRTYRKMIPSILRVQREHIFKLLGREQYRDLLLKLRDGNELTESEAGLLAVVSEVTVLHSFSRALPAMSVKVNAGSVFVISDVDGMNTKQTAHLQTIEFLKNQTESDAGAAETHLLAYLYENQDDLPIWAESQAKKDADENDQDPFTFGAGGLFM